MSRNTCNSLTDWLTLAITLVAVVISVHTVRADSFVITHYTIDGGGGSSNGSGFDLTGTIGQPDAGLHSGGGFLLRGGFWHGSSAEQGCTCPGDMNGDGLLDGSDIQQFIDCYISDTACTCADMDGTNGMTAGDITLFVQALLDAETCN